MPLNIDIQNLSKPSITNFSVLMMRLYTQSDPSNRHKIALGWPNLVAVYEAWYRNPNDIPNLPYDSR